MPQGHELLWGTVGVSHMEHGEHTYVFVIMCTSQLTIELPPDKSTGTWKMLEVEMHLLPLTY